MVENLFSPLISAILLFSTSLSAQTPCIYVNNIPLYAAETVAVGDELYVPLRKTAEALGDVQISWDQEQKAASVTGSGLTLRAASDSLYIIANGRYLYTPRGVLTVDNRIMVPAETIAKAFCATLEVIDSQARFSKGSNPITSDESYYNKDDLYWLSRIIHAESMGESLTGKIAVGNVVMNRVKSSQFPNSVYDVIFDSSFGVQFTPAATGSIYNTPSEESVIAAKIVLEGYNNAGSSLYFLNPAIASSDWISNNRDYTLTIGNHSFYS